jgi:hypothetical protein
MCLKKPYRILFVILAFSLVSLSCQLVNRAIPQFSQPSRGNPAPAATLPPGKGSISPTAAAGGSGLKADSQPLPNGLVLASPDETAAILQNKKAVTFTAAPPESYSNEELNKVGSTLNYTIKAAAAEDVFPWISAWCASSPKILAQNLTQMEQELTINGQAVDMSSVLQNEYTSPDGQTCHGYYLAIYGWPSSKVTIEEKIIFNAAVNDGALDFPAGVMTRIFEISLEHAESFSADH